MSELPRKTLAMSAEETFPNLPQELIDDILYRLPVKSIQRFMCVSKQWQTSIKTPEFVKSYLEYSDSDEPENLLCVVDNLCLYVLTFNAKENNGSLREITSPFEVDFFEVEGSCNGLVLLVGYNFGDNKVLMNPITLEFERVIDDSVYDRFIAFGMGYDHSKDDYKIVSLNRENDTLDRCRSVEIYSFKAKTWRRISNMGNLLVYEHLRDTKQRRYVGVFVNGCLHWIAFHSTDTGKWNYIISAFNLAQEEFGEIAPPPCDGGAICHRYPEMRVLRGYLGLIHTYSHHVLVWLMREYGVPDSWTKLTFKPYEAVFMNSIVFLLNDYELVFKEDGRPFVACDSTSEAYPKNLVVSDRPRFGRISASGIVAFRPSLVSPSYN